MAKKSGGPAFHGGMSLRDYFAAQAILLFADAAVLVSIQQDAKAKQISVESFIAKSAYEMADAMIAECEK